MCKFYASLLNAKKCVYADLRRKRKEDLPLNDSTVRIESNSTKSMCILSVRMVIRFISKYGIRVVVGVSSKT